MADRILIALPSRVKSRHFRFGIGAIVIILVTVLFWVSAFKEIRDSSEIAARNLEQKTDSWLGSLALISRLRVIESSMSFGAYEPVESVLNQFMLYQAEAESVAVWNIDESLFAASNMSSTGLFLGTSKYVLGDIAKSFNFKQIRDNKHGTIQVGLHKADKATMIAFRKPIFFDEENIGYIGIVINEEKIKSWLAGSGDLLRRIQFQISQNSIAPHAEGMSLKLSKFRLPGMHVFAYVPVKEFISYFIGSFCLVIVTTSLILLLLNIVIYLLQKNLILPMRFVTLLMTDNRGARSFIQNLPLAAKPWARKLLNIFEENRHLRNRETEFQLAKSKHLMARQVAHDIRSPLSALSLVLGSVNSLPEEKRVLIRNAVQRINDVANNLLLKTKVPDVGVSESNLNECIMLSHFLDAIVSEKRTQYSEIPNFVVNFSPQDAYGCFIKANRGELAAALSNLIDNAVDACQSAPRIDITVIFKDDCILIQIRDSGKGIPESVLDKIGERGFSFGKELAGNGLGVAQAKDVISNIGGEITISSELGKGTKVCLKIPKCKSPAWYLDVLNLQSSSVLVTVDDDKTVHEVWAQRLKRETKPNNFVTHFGFTTIISFKNWLNENSKFYPDQSLTFLVDFEFLNETKTGFDVLKDLDEIGQKILVTSYCDDPVVLTKALILGVRVVPKSMSPFIPIRISPGTHNAEIKCLEFEKDDLIG